MVLPKYYYIMLILCRELLSFVSQLNLSTTEIFNFLLKFNGEYLIYLCPAIIIGLIYFLPFHLQKARKAT